MSTTWKLDPTHSELTFKVKHMMISNVKGEFTSFEAEITTEDDTFSKAKVSASIKTDSVFTNNTDRDTHLKSADFFNAEKFPKMTFVMKSYESDKMKGDLTIRGITKPVVLEVEDLSTIKDFDGNNRIGFTLKGKINRMDYDLKWNKALEAGGVAVSEEVKIIVDVEAVEK